MAAPPKPTAKVRDRQGTELDASIPIKLAEIREPDGRVTGGGTATLAEVADAHDRAAERQAWEEHERREADLAVRHFASRPRLVRARPRQRRERRAARRATSAARDGPSDEPPSRPRARGPRHIRYTLADAVDELRTSLRCWFRPGLDLGFVDRAPLLWRLRVLRCRWHEWREGWPP
jgi:hypothetical protein